MAAADANPYEAPAREFARRVAASFPAETHVGVEVRNRSTLAAIDVATVRGALLDELSARGLRVGSSTADAAPSVTVTLSENAEGFLWVAEIRSNGSYSVTLMAVRRAAAKSPAEFSGITLRSSLLWSGREHVLAAATFPVALGSASAAIPPAASFSASGNAQDLLLLATDDATTSVTDARQTFKIALPPSGSAVRDAQGALAWNGSSVTATAYGQTCVFSMPPATSTPQCRAYDTEPAQATLAAQIGSQRAVVPVPCGEASGEILAAGAGDYTQPDYVRAYQMRGGTVTAVSSALEFSGPVMSLQTTTPSQAGSSPSALAVVRNLTTGDDEVYEISLICGH
ncbi:MAG: hypothetical protein WBF35_11070 [Candidatus Acidiferrales bacterium]